MTQVSTQPRSPAEHYQDCVRLLAVAESTGTDDNVQTVAALAAIGHALLAAAPRRARRVPQPPGRHTHGISPQARWMYGDDDHSEGAS
jgi:hypothetical protein